MDTDKYVEILGEQINKLGSQIDGVKEEVHLVKEVLNNGIVSATHKNTKKVEELTKKLNKLEIKNDSCDSYNQGKTETWKIILAAVILGGNLLLGLLEVASYFGLINGGG